MIIAGAKGHALEVYGVITAQANTEGPIVFYDDISKDLPHKIFNKYEIITDPNLLKPHFLADSKFMLGVGSPWVRRLLSTKLREAGGVLTSVISPHAIIGKHTVSLGHGLNIMHHCFISEQVRIGEGSLVNAGGLIHHDVTIGDYAVLAPRSTILGGASIGNDTFIGAGATILPKVEIGSNCLVGAGAVVTKNLPNHTKAYGVPARIIGYN